jgi:putative addiction module component (TIGR02574 family)
MAIRGPGEQYHRRKAGTPTIGGKDMSPQGIGLPQEAKKLPPMERAELIELLPRTFDFPERQAIDARWAIEADDRVAAHERGEMTSLPADEVFRRIEKKPPR